MGVELHQAVICFPVDSFVYLHGIRGTARAKIRNAESMWPRYYVLGKERLRQFLRIEMGSAWPNP
jgi:hypothetical protein